ncbi:MAG: trigger factor [bacterium]
METKIIKQGNSQRIIEVELTQEELEPHFDALYRKYQKNIRLEGFRQGKVPLGLIKKIYGEEITNKAIDEVVQNVYKEVRDKENLKPIAPAKVEDINYNPENGLHFKAIVEVLPDFELKHYKEVSVDQEVYEIGEEDVEEALQDVREQMAVMHPVEEGAKEEHYILADLQEIDTSGVPVIGKKYEDQLFQLSSNNSNKELTEQLIGVKPGEYRRVQLSSLQTDGSNEKKIETYNVKIKEIKEKQLPELDDELAKDFGQFENLEAFRSHIREKLIKKKEADSRRLLRRGIIDEILKKNPLDLPESMINNYLDAIIDNAKKGAKGAIDEQEIRENYRPSAIWSLKWELIKDKIVELENLTVTDEDKRNYIRRISEERGVDEKLLWNKLNNQEAQNRFLGDVLEEKVLDFLEKNAKINKMKITRRDIEKRKQLAISP